VGDANEPRLLPWRIELFGGLSAARGDLTLCRFRTRKTGSLLGYLAYHLGRSHPRDALTHLFWSDGEMDAGRQSFRMALSSLRHALQSAGDPAAAVLRSDRAYVGLHPDYVATDVQEFHQTLHAAAQASSPAGRVALLTRAADVYRGELLAGYYDDWIIPERQRLSQLFALTVRQLVSCLEEQGDLAGAIHYMQRAVDADPLDEDTQSALIRLYLAGGQRRAALRQYRRLEQLLSEDSGSAPAAATTALIRHLWKSGGPVPLPGFGKAPAMSRPEGTVTFLLAELRGKSGRANDSGDGTDCLVLLQRECRRRGGYELPGGAGTFQAAFARATDAVACALAAQRDWTAHSMPAVDRPIRLRLALDTTEVELHQGDYPAPALAGAAAALACAQAGQIVCRETTALLFRRDLFPQVGLEEVGAPGRAGVGRVFRLEAAPAQLRGASKSGIEPNTADSQH